MCVLALYWFSEPLFYDVFYESMHVGDGLLCRIGFGNCDLSSLGVEMLVIVYELWFS